MQAEDPTRLIDFPGTDSAFSAFNFSAMPARTFSNSAIRRAAPSINPPVQRPVPT